MSGCLKYQKTLPRFRFPTTKVTSDEGHENEIRTASDQFLLQLEIVVRVH